LRQTPNCTPKHRLRDAVAAGVLAQVHVLAPDRLARRYAYQVLLVEEFRRAGAEVVFVNRPIGPAPRTTSCSKRRG